jgi:uncharacterized protein (TIGR03118 family)
MAVHGCNRIRSRFFGAILLAGLLPVLSGFANAQRVHQFNLISDVPGVAKTTDTLGQLVNPWGIAFSATGPFWIADNGSGLSTIYAGQTPITQQGLVVTVPPAAGGTGGTPTGIVFNGTGAFPVSKNMVSGSSFFIFATEDGTLAGWSPSVDLNNAITVVDNSKPGGVDHSEFGAVYKGLALVTTPKGSFIFAANFRDRKVEIYDSNFTYVKSFRDPNVPRNYAPFGIQTIGQNVYVTYAQQDATRHDDVPGNGHGYVDVFGPHGGLIKRLVTQGPLNSPWGIALAPANFGTFSNALLIGNFGNGWINAFDPTTGAALGFLEDSHRKPIAIDGLWGLAFGNGHSAGRTNELFFTAGIQGEAHGLFGKFTAFK